MTRQADVVSEERTKREHLALIKAMEYDLVGSVAHSGGVLTGFSVKIGEWETLVTLRAVVAGRPQIAFVGGDSLTSTILKCVRQAKQDKLRWRADRYGKE